MIDLVASNPLMRTVILIGIFALVMLVSLMGSMAMARHAGVRRDLRRLAGDDVLADEIEHDTLSLRGKDAWTRLVTRIEASGLNLGDTREDSLRQKLRAAGYASAAAVRVYSLLRLVLVIGLPLLFVAGMFALGRQLSILSLYAACCFWAAVGLYGPALYVRIRADRRREAIINGFPDCLDLLLICVEAGYGMEAAFDRVGREMAVSHPLVAALLTAVTLRQRAGASREEALRLLAEEAGVDEITSFTTLMIQSDKLGTSIATTLRVYASEMRERRRMRAEEKAHRIPVLISVPLVTCMLPVMIGVLMLPAVIITLRKLIPALAGEDPEMRYIASGMMALALGGCTLFQAPRHQASPPSFRVAGGTAQEAEQHAQTALEAGRRALDQGQTGLAIEAFRQALDAGGSPAPALNGLGVAYARLGDLETAARLFEEASAMAPDQASYHANMARAAEALGKAGPTQAGQARGGRTATRAGCGRGGARPDLAA